MMILRLFFGPRSAQQAALKGPQLPEMFWVPQGRGWDAFPNSQGSLLSIAPTQALDPNTFLKLSQDYQPWILFIHSFIQQILYGESYGSVFLFSFFFLFLWIHLFLCMDDQLSQHHLLERLSFL